MPGRAYSLSFQQDHVFVLFYGKSVHSFDTYSDLSIISIKKKKKKKKWCWGGGSWDKKTLYPAHQTYYTHTFLHTPHTNITMQPLPSPHSTHTRLRACIYAFVYANTHTHILTLSSVYNTQSHTYAWSKYHVEPTGCRISLRSKRFKTVQSNLLPPFLMSSVNSWNYTCW